MCHSFVKMHPSISLILAFMASTTSVHCQDETTEAAISTGNIRCTSEELEQFSEEYETCHHKAYEAIKSQHQLGLLLKKTKEDSKPLTTGESDDDKLVCKALTSLINECTLVLGWCFPNESVIDTKKKQWEITRSALADMDIYCDEDAQALPEDGYTDDLFLANSNARASLILPLQQGSGARSNNVVLLLAFLPMIIAIVVCS